MSHLPENKSGEILARKPVPAGVGRGIFPIVIVVAFSIVVAFPSLPPACRPLLGCPCAHARSLPARTSILALRLVHRPPLRLFFPAEPELLLTPEELAELNCQDEGGVPASVV